MKAATANSVPSVEKEPELATEQEQVESGVRFKKTCDDSQLSGDASVLVAKRASWEPQAEQVEKPVEIISYMGSLPDTAGNDGDFYIDEMTNMLYGPKVAGVWPEEGVSAAGLCKRTWIAVKRAGATAPKGRGGFLGTLLSLMRFLRHF